MKSEEKDIDLVFGLIRKWIEEVKYGNINLIIQDGKIIQIDKTEKTRI